MSRAKRSERILTLFRRQVVAFLDELIQQFPDETGLIFCRIAVNDAVSPCDLMSRSILYILPHEKKISRKDDRYFLNGKDMFSNLSTTHKGEVGRMKRIWVSERLNGDDREAIWAWFEAFVSMIKQYQVALMEEINSSEHRIQGDEEKFKVAV